MCSQIKLRTAAIVIPIILLIVALDFVFSNRKALVGAEQRQETQTDDLAGIERKPNPLIEMSVATVQKSESGVSNFITEGRRIFRFDTYGDEEFWGDRLQLHKSIEKVSPKKALALGLKVDVKALPNHIIRKIKEGNLNLDDPNNTLLLLKRNAIVGVTGFFNDDGTLKSIGFQCSLCHSTVNNSLIFGIGGRLDGWANSDLDVGSIIALSPNLNVIATILNTSVEIVKKVFNSWGPGKFDAELMLDGKGFRPDGDSAATMIPNAFGLAGFNLHTWTGAWGTVTYWNVFVANIELHGKGTFFDPRLDDASKFPIAAKEGFGNLRAKSDEDLVTSKLPALHFYQLSLPAPKSKAGIHFDKDAAERGKEIFEGKGDCNNCHITPLWSEPGRNLHEPKDIGIDSFQADRAPDNRYKTANLEGLFIREFGIFMKQKNKGRFFHDGRFATLKDVIKHYNTALNLSLSDQQMNDLVEYLKSL